MLLYTSSKFRWSSFSITNKSKDFVPRDCSAVRIKPASKKVWSPFACSYSGTIFLDLKDNFLHLGHYPVSKKKGKGSHKLIFNTVFQGPLTAFELCYFLETFIGYIVQWFHNVIEISTGTLSNNNNNLYFYFVKDILSFVNDYKCKNI